MKKIIDVNYLRDSELRKYLEEDKDNSVLFTDYACMESLKGGSLINIKKSLKIISNFPDQVLVLKNTNDILNENLYSLQQNDSLIDQNQTNEFCNFCLGVKKTSEGDSFFGKQLLEKSQLATSDLEKKKDYASIVLNGIELLSKELDQNFVKVLRTTKPWTSSEYEYIWRSVIYICKKLFEKHNKVPDKNNFIRHYIFRYALASYLLALKWIGDGGWQNYSKEDMRNDLVDMSYVAYATYFDGVLSKDSKINEIYEKTNNFIDKITNA